jgi:cyclase
MLARRIIPCLDVDRGRVVKGIRFVDLVDAGDPVEQARHYDAEGADELVFLDITASSDRRERAAELARAVADSVFIPFCVGGGIRTADDMAAVLGSGADKVSVNTAALRDPRMIGEGARRFGSQAIVVAIDARRVSAREDSGIEDSERESRREGTWEVTSHGGRHAEGRDAVDWAREAVERGAGEILLTSMDRDGTGDGYDIDLLRAVTGAVRVPVIASGGAGTVEHMVEALTVGGASAVLAASIFHFGKVAIPELRDALRGRGVRVR